MKRLFILFIFILICGFGAQATEPQKTASKNQNKETENVKIEKKDDNLKAKDKNNNRIAKVTKLKELPFYEKFVIEILGIDESDFLT